MAGKPSGTRPFWENNIKMDSKKVKGCVVVRRIELAVGLLQWWTLVLSVFSLRYLLLAVCWTTWIRFPAVASVSVSLYYCIQTGCGVHHTVTRVLSCALEHSDNRPSPADVAECRAHDSLRHATLL